MPKLKSQSCKYHIIHLVLIKKLKEKAKGSKILPIGEVLEVFRRTFFNVPRPVHYAILKEMEEAQLLKKLDQKKVQLMYTDCDKILNEYIFSLW